jgi:hypothetical protein
MFVLSTLFFLWHLSFLAIAKEVALSGWGRWETAYTIFVASAALLSVLLPFKVYSHLKRLP